MKPSPLTYVFRSNGPFNGTKVNQNRNVVE